jgi:hypothetical protein
MRKYIWYLVASLYIATFVLGLVGLDKLPAGDNFPHKEGWNSWFTIAIMLLGEATWTTQVQIPWQVDAARWLAITSTFSYISLLFLQDKFSYFYRWKAQFSSGHIIIISETEMCLELGRAMLGMDKKIICITLDDMILSPDAPEYEKFVFFSGQKNLLGILEKANATKAGFIMVWANDPNKNDEVSWLIKNNLSTKVQHKKGCRLLVKSSPLVPVNMDAELDENLGKTTLQIYSILPDALNVESILKSFPPEVFADALGASQVHIAIHGFGPYGATFLLEAVRQGVFRPENQKLKISIFDKSNGEDFHALQRAFPSVGDYVELDHHIIEKNEDAFFKIETNNQNPPTLHIISPDFCLDEIQYAQLLRTITTSQKNKNAPIVLADMVGDENKIARLNTRRIYCYQPKNVGAIIEHFIDEKIEKIGKAFHNDYLQSNDISISDNPDQAWELIPNWARVSNRSAASHLETKLRAINYIQQAGNNLTTLEKEKIAPLAKMEHKRWILEKITMGYQKSQTRNDHLLLHNKLNGWDALSDNDKGNNFDQVAAIPAILRNQLNIQIKPLYIIGVTGHRALPKGEKLIALKDKINIQMFALKTKHPNHHFHILTALADGADRLVLDCALNVLKASFDIILPMPEEYYLDDFEKNSNTPYVGREDFFKWKKLARFVMEVPLRFATSKDLPMGGEPRNLQYALAGAYVAERSDQLIAIWNGKPARGTGGTGEVVEWAKANAVPENLKLAQGYFPTPKKSEPIIIWEE